MDPSDSTKTYLSRFSFPIFLSVSICLGVFLRLYQINGQIIGDDEWHSICVAVKNSLGYILTHYHVSDNCIPLTVYYKFLLQTIGLSEWGLRSLQIVSGILCLILLPLMVRSILAERVSIIFSFLLSISPFLIYFSRYARPYIIVVLLCVTSLFSFYLWIKRGRTVFSVVFLITGILAPYFHLFSIFTVLSPLVWSIIFLALAKISHKEVPSAVAATLTQLVYCAVLLCIGVSIWFIPAFDSFQALTQKVSGGFIEYNTLLGAANLFAGSKWQVVSYLWFGISLYGLYCIRKDLLLFGILSFAILFQLSAIFVVKPLAVEIPVVFARYAISILPVWLLLIAIGLNDISLRLAFSVKNRITPVISNGIPTLFLMFAFLDGPLFNIYGGPNNFTNHTVFQYDYSHKWTDMDKDQAEEVFPEFYFHLAGVKQQMRIIEAPFLVPWSWNTYFLYQRLHRKQVLIGHSGDSYIADANPVMHPNIHFYNWVDLGNSQQVAESNAGYVVIHKDLFIEAAYLGYILVKGPVELTQIVRRTMDADHGIKAAIAASRREATKMIEYLNKNVDRPCYEDDLIAVFKLNGRGHSLGRTDRRQP